MTPHDWIDDEPTVGEALVQAARLIATGIRRPLVLLLATAAFALVLGGALVLRKHSFAPRYVLRVVEPDRDPGSAPRPRRQLAEYVKQAVFTSEPLLAILHEHSLYPGLSRKNPRAALDSFREDIEVEVYQNYFVEERAVGSAPRSARLAVSYHNADRDTAVGVTRELGELIVRHEKGTRRDEIVRAAELAKRDVDVAREALARRRAEVALRTDELGRLSAASPERQVELVGLLGSLPALELRQDASERREASLALGAALERHGIGMSFEVVDDGTIAAESGGTGPRVVLGLTSFVLGLPLLAMAVGTFAPGKRGVA